MILLLFRRGAEHPRQGTGLLDEPNAPNILLVEGYAPSRTVFGGVLSRIMSSWSVAFFSLWVNTPVYGRVGLVPHGGRNRGLFGVSVCVCISCSRRPVLFTRPRRFSCVLFLVAAAPQLMLGASRVGSWTRDLWRWRAPQVLRLWDCLAWVQCEAGARPRKGQRCVPVARYSCEAPLPYL